MTAEYSIRSCAPDDLDAWWELRLKSLQDHPEAYASDFGESRASGPRYAERGYFGDGPNRIFGAYTPDGQIVGQAGCYRETGKRSHIGQVISVYTLPHHRGRGLATQLVQACINHLQGFPDITSIRISVNADNVPAIRTYEKLGFEPRGDEPDAIRTDDGTCHNERHMVLHKGA